MFHTAHIRTHRKPRNRNASTIVMRAGVAGSVLSLAVAGASATANAAEPVTQTLELPALTSDLATQVAQSAAATQQAAANYELHAEQDEAASQAAQQAQTDMANAKKKAAEAQRSAEAQWNASAQWNAKAPRKQAKAASRSTERPTLTASASVPTDSSTTGSSTATGSAAAVISFVEAQTGKAYVSGGTGPSAYDCSGLVQTAFKQIGINLPRVSQAQSTAGTQVSVSNLQPGDILYWGSAGSAYHVAVYVGDGMFVGAQNPSRGVVKKSLSYDPPSGAVRVL